MGDQNTEYRNGNRKINIRGRVERRNQKDVWKGKMTER